MAITYWEIPVHVVTTISGGLMVDVTLNLRLRADVHGHRMGPTAQRNPNRPIIGMASMQETDAQYSASGEVSQSVDGVTTTIIWSGSGNVANRDGMLQAYGAGSLAWATRRLQLVIHVNNGIYQERTVVRRGAETLRDTTGPKPTAVTAPTDAFGLLEFAFDERWGLLAGRYDGAPVPVELLGARTLTTSVVWGAVTPAYPPLDATGGV